jgi:hypothetical protein
MYDHIATLTDGRTGRCSSWDTTGRNQDRWAIGPGETRTLADSAGPGVRCVPTGAPPCCLNQESNRSEAMPHERI